MTRSPRTVPPCLACRQTPGHAERCAATDNEATYYLRHPLPQGYRDWTPAGIRYTGTPARRTAIRTLMANTQWVRMIGTPELPASPAWLINQILAGFGPASRKTTRVGYNPGDFLTTLDCGCDPWRCTHDHDSPTTTPPSWLTHPGLDPDLLIIISLVAVELRWADTWQTYWFADTGSPVNLAVDTVTEASPPGISVACHRRWCDLCPGDTKPRLGGTVRPPCSCACHTGATP